MALTIENANPIIPNSRITMLSCTDISDFDVKFKLGRLVSGVVYNPYQEINVTCVASGFYSIDEGYDAVGYGKLVAAGFASGKSCLTFNITGSVTGRGGYGLSSVGTGRVITPITIFVPSGAYSINTTYQITGKVYNVSGYEVVNTVIQRPVSGFYTFYNDQVYSSGFSGSLTGSEKVYYNGFQMIPTSPLMGSFNIDASNLGLSFDTTSVLYQGTGGPLCDSGFSLRDPLINLDSSLLNDNWGDSLYSGIIKNTLQKAPDYVTDASEIYKTTYDTLYTLQIHDKLTDGTNSGTINVELVDKQIPNVININSSNSEAWVSYNMSGFDNNFKIVKAYAIEINSDIQATGDVRLFAPLYGTLPEVVWNKYSGTFTCNSSLVGVHSTGCTYTDEQQMQIDALTSATQYICVTGGVTGSAQDILKADLQNKINAIRNFGKITDNKSTNESNTSGFTTTYSGWIVYNQPVSGDEIILDVYDYNFSSLYQQYYHTVPPYPAYSFSFKYGQDFVGSGASGAQSLTNSLNSKLNSGYNLWFNYSGANLDPSGYFQNGPILTAHYVPGTGLQEMDIQSKLQNSGYSLSGSHVILLTSARVGTIAQHFKWSDKKAVRTQEPSAILRKKLVPNYIYFEGYNGSTWTTLDSRFVNWANVTPTKFTVPLSGWEPYVKTGETDPDQFNFPNDDPAFVVLEEGSIKGKDNCGQEVIISGQVISGTDCNPPETTPTIPTDPDGNPISTGNGVESGYHYVRIGEITHNALRTGYLVNNITAYDSYRIRFTNLNYQSSQKVIQDNTFSVRNINFFYQDTGIPVHTGGPLNIIGGQYDVQISGQTTGTIGACWSGYPNSPSGVFYDNVDFASLPAETDLWLNQYHVKPIPGALFGNQILVNLTGQECGSIEFDGYFYDPVTSILTRKAYLTGCVTGAAIFSGYVFTVDPADLANGSGFMQKYGYSFVSGVFNSNFFSDNVEGFSTLTGHTGRYINLSDSGVFTIDQTLCHFPAVAYQNYYTGEQRAKGSVTINSPIFGDSFNINGNTITYLGVNTSPNYYNDVTGFYSILTGNISTFEVDPILSGNTIYLTSTRVGVDGNTTALSYAGTGTSSVSSGLFLTGGRTDFLQMTPTTAFCGFLASRDATGFVTAIASGTISGPVSVWTGERTFITTWDLATGINNSMASYNSNLWISNDSGTYTNYGTVPPKFFTQKADSFNIRVSYTNGFPKTGTDLVELIISGLYDFPTGLNITISGNSP